MRSGVWIACLAAVAMVGGCGEDKSDGQSSSASKPAPVQPERPASLKLAEFAVRDELEGFEPMTEGAGATEAQAWLDLAQETTVTAEEYKKLGFVAGFKRDLKHTEESNVFGLSLVVQFQTPEQAQAEVKRYGAATEPGIKLTPFKVDDLAGAEGFTGEGSTVGDNVTFAKGEHFYLVGRMRLPDMSASESRKTVVDAAKAVAAKGA